MAKTSEADLYSNYSIPDFINDQLTIQGHPRARGKHEIDTTVLFDSQRDRDLEQGQWQDQYPPRCAIHVRPGSASRLLLTKVLWTCAEGRVVLDRDNHPFKGYRSINMST